MDRSASVLRRDEIVEGVDLGVERVENGLTTDTVFAGGDGLARRRRLVEVNAVRAAGLLVIGRIDAALAHCRPAHASGSNLSGLAATLRVCSLPMSQCS